MKANDNASDFRIFMVARYTRALAIAKTIIFCGYIFLYFSIARFFDIF